MAQYDSPFKGFWTDKPDALQQLDRKLAAGEISDDEAQSLREFIVDGYTVLKKAIPDEITDRLLAEIRTVDQAPEKYIARRERQAYTHPTSEVVQDKTFRLIDFHVNSATARDIQFARPIQRILQLVFEAQPLAFQSLTFIHGSQQGIHQDGAYVVVDEPIKFAASWVALEDVVEGSGELLYFPGSHRMEDYLFSGAHKSWQPSRDGEDAGRLYIKSLWDRIRERNIPQQRFLPKKGDVLIWAADLVHGGAKIHNDHTRRSLVTHYCPKGVSPNYRNFFGDYREKQHSSGSWYSSRHYDLAEQETGHEQLEPVFMGTARQQKQAS